MMFPKACSSLNENIYLIFYSYVLICCSSLSWSFPLGPSSKNIPAPHRFRLISVTRNGNFRTSSIKNIVETTSNDKLVAPSSIYFDEAVNPSEFYTLSFDCGDGGGGKNLIDNVNGKGDDDDDGSDQSCIASFVAKTTETTKGDSIKMNQRHSFLSKVNSSFRKTWQHYVFLLTYFPLVTNALTAGVIGLIGDFMAQYFESAIASKSSRDDDREFLFDMKRTFAVTVESLLFSGPGLHYFFNLLENYIPTSSGRLIPVAQHVLLDTLFIDPIFIASFFVTTAFFEGKNMRHEMIPQFEREFWPAVVSSFKLSVLFWPLQMACFKYLPLTLRPLSMNVSDIAWTAMLSFFSHKSGDKLVNENIATNQQILPRTDVLSKMRGILLRHPIQCT